jgi:hypothetical protein
VQWLTIPVAHSGRSGQRIDEAETTDPRWPIKHWKSLAQNYSRAPYFAQYAERFEELYRQIDAARVAVVNRLFIDAICDTLGITTSISSSSDYTAEGNRSERVLALCQAVGATRYLSGPSAQGYLDEGLFRDAGIEVEYMDYSGYPEYPQLHPPFDHAVTVLDLIFNVGHESPAYMKSFRSEALAAAR